MKPHKHVTALTQPNLNQLAFKRFEKNLCDGRKECEILPRFLAFNVGHHLIAPDFNITLCVIFKNFSTVLRSIMCFLYNAESYQKEVKDLMDDKFEIRHCKNKNEFIGDIGEKKLQWFERESGKIFNRYSVTRDPIERFVSGFLDKCLYSKNISGGSYENRKNPCGNCGGNITCFGEFIFSELSSIVRTNLKKYTLETEHFAPQNWNCNFKEAFAKYTSKRLLREDKETGSQQIFLSSHL
ncbi:unnamed protein product, partial [Mesorhabditis belari]|uniref:Uncharacterized protein n=1 Tax=Mesorhabditis belari TaxID=2138241 RepID=A0AAF3ETB7_9BILA